MTALHILIAEPDSSAALMAAQILMNNGHSVETCGDGIQALQAIRTRSKSGQPYHALICAYALPGLDAIRLMGELHMAGLQPATALLSQAGHLAPAQRTQALKLGCKTFFDYPIPLTELNEFIQHISAHTTSNDDGPYFGTSKFSKKATQEISGGHKTVTPVTNQYQRTPSGQLRPGSYKRQSTGTFQVGSANTGRIRRSTTGAFAQDTNTIENKTEPQTQTTHSHTPQPLPPIDNPFEQQAAQAQHNTHIPLNPLNPQSTATTTARIRRSTTGSFASEEVPQAAPAPAPAPATYQVACAHCQKVFLVQAHPQEYNAACAHCAGLNRIVPR